MIKRFLLLLSALLLTTSAVLAQQQATPEEIGTFMQQDDLKTYKLLQEYTTLRFAASDFEDFPLSSDLLSTSYRSPGKAFLYSVMMPGVGQIYTNSKVKAGFFMTVEIAAWVGYMVYHGKGRDQEKQNNEFADNNWSPAQYTNWLIETYGITSDTAEYIGSDGKRTRFTHHLPSTKTQQYYEMIGKYEQFRYGWADTDYLRGKDSSDMRNEYLKDRDEANSAFTRAKAGAIVSIANHLLSGLDAAFSAKRHNHKQDTFTELSLKARLARYEGRQIPKLILTYRF